MTDNELEICKRFKEIRTTLKRKQGSFAAEIRTTQGHVSDIENGRKGVSDRVIEIICLKFSVNEEWFRTGDGEMFNLPEDETAAIVSELLEESNPTYDLILSIVKTYQQLDAKSQGVLDDFILKLSENIKKEG